MSHLPDPTADGQQVKREGGLWRQQGLLWDIGAAFVESDADDLDATVEWALEKLATSVQGTSASIWRAEPSASESTVHWRWVRSEGLDLGPDARLEARHEVAAALAKTDGAAILALEALVGEEAVAEHGWTGGIGAVVVVDITEDEVVTLVVASLEPDWGDTELLYFRGFGTLLRQFLARVRAEKALDYRLQLEDLVSSSVGQLVSLDAEGWDRLVRPFSSRCSAGSPLKALLFSESILEVFNSRALPVHWVTSSWRH